jgi:hypothetical protein
LTVSKSKTKTPFLNQFQLIEYALSCLPFESVTIKTPQGKPYEGKRCLVSKICGVSILRAGINNINNNNPGVRLINTFSPKL